MIRIALTLAFTASTAVAQAPTPQYRSPAGVQYVSQADTGNVARAESAYARDPRNVERLVQLGLAHASVRQYREAILTFTRGLQLDPNNAILYRWRGHRYLSVREIDSAHADLTRGASLDSTIYAIWYHLGVVRFVRGEFATAADAFARGLRGPPDDNERAGSYDWLWMSLSRASRPAEARAVLERLRAGDSLRVTSATAYVQRLRLYQGLVSPDQVLTPADTSDIAVATLSFGVGNWYLVKGDTVQARAWFERAVRSGGWPAFGFIAAEAELRRLR